MSLYFGEDAEATDDNANLRIAKLMAERRSRLHEQMVADEVKNDLCNAVIEWRNRLGIDNQLMSELKNSDNAAFQKLHDYIRRLETFQSVFWCPKCTTMMSVSEKPAALECQPDATKSPDELCLADNDSVHPDEDFGTAHARRSRENPQLHARCEESILEMEIPDAPTMLETAHILRALQKELRELKGSLRPARDGSISAADLLGERDLDACDRA